MRKVNALTDLVEDTLGSNETPNDRGRVVDLGAVLAVEVGSLLGGTDAVEAVDKVDDTVADEAGDDGRDQLTTVHGARGNLGVKTHLLVRNVVVGLAVDVVAESLDEHESLGVAGKGVTDNQLSDDVQALGGTGDGVKVGHGNQENGVQAQDEKDGPDGNAERVLGDDDDGQDKGDGNDGQEPPVGHLGVGAHEVGERVIKAIVDGAVRREDGPEMLARLAEPTAAERAAALCSSDNSLPGTVDEATEKTLEALGDLTPHVEDDEGEGQGVVGEEHAVQDKVASAVEGGRVFLVKSLVELTVDNNPAGVVGGTSVVKDARGVGGKVGSPLGVAEVDTKDGTGRNQQTGVLLNVGKSGLVQRSPVDAHVVPVESGKGVEAHTKLRASDCSELEVVGRDPRDPCKVAESGEDVVWEPEVDTHGAEEDPEELVPGPGPAVDSLLLVVIDQQGSVQGQCGQGARPEGKGGVDDEAAKDTGEAQAHDQG